MLPSARAVTPRYSEARTTVMGSSNSTQASSRCTAASRQPLIRRASSAQVGFTLISDLDHESFESTQRSTCDAK